MYSAKNNLKTWVSNFSYPYMGDTTSTLAELPAGAVGFYSEAGLLLSTGVGTGFLAFRKPSGEVVKSNVFYSGVTWLNRIDGYTAPVLEKQTITVTAANSTLYEIRLEMKIPGMGGGYIKHGVYKSAASGDDATEIAAALALSLNNALARESKSFFTITSSVGDIIIEAKHLTYTRGKKSGRPPWFKATLIYPEAQAANATLTTAHSDGSGYAPYIAEKEFFSQGDSDELRFGGWPNSFDDKGLLTQVSPTLAQYDVAAFTVNDATKTSNGPVYATQEYLVCFNSIGATPPPTVNVATAGTPGTASGFAVPGSIVTMYIGAVGQTPTATANSTTGAWSKADENLSGGNVVTATAKDGSAAESVASAGRTV